MGDRLRLFNFAQRDDPLAYLWVLRAMNVLRAVHQLQVHPDDVANALNELATAHDEVPAGVVLTALTNIGPSPPRSTTAKTVGEPTSGAVTSVE